MKTKKLNLKLSAGSLTLNKETVVELTANQMNGIKGGVTYPTDLTCHSINPDACLSNDTRCYSMCQTGCDFTFGCTVPTASNDCTHGIC